MSDPRYHKPYARLTSILTEMYADERRLLDVSPDYVEIMEHVLAGRDAEAVAMALRVRTHKGDEWRLKAYELDMLDSPDFIRNPGERLLGEARS